MSWLRIDDGFTQHPKVIQLGVRDRWTWLDVLCYCARYRTGGTVTDTISEVVRGATPGFLSRCYGVGLLDRAGDVYVVHDWNIYNGSTLDERVTAYLLAYPQASANEVVKSIGGSRNQVLESVARYRSGTASTEELGKSGAAPGTAPGTEVVRKSVSRARSPAPVVQEPSVSPSRSSTPGARDASDEDGLTDISSNIEEARRALGLTGEVDP